MTKLAPHGTTKAHFEGFPISGCFLPRDAPIKDCDVQGCDLRNHTLGSTQLSNQTEERERERGRGRGRERGRESGSRFGLKLGLCRVVALRLSLCGPKGQEEPYREEIVKVTITLARDRV